MAKRDTLVAAMDKYLNVSAFQDYLPPGLQVEGASTVKKVVTGVSFSMELLDAAKESNSQLVLVHHGTFWRGQSPVLRGTHKERIAFLLEHNLTLVAYHLALDAHAVVGNNAQIIKMLGVRNKKLFGMYNGSLIGFMGTFQKAKSLKEIASKLQLLCGDDEIYEVDEKKKIKKVAVVSGGAGDLFEQAIDHDADLYITGEPWEPAQALARETGVSFMALGHYNSEKPGVMALGQWLKKRFKVGVDFVDVPNSA